MSGMIQLQPGQTVKLNAEQMQQLHLSSFTPEREGCGTSDLPPYAGYNFTWLPDWDTIRPEDWRNDQVSTFQRTNFVYHLTMHHQHALPPLNTPTVISGVENIRLAIRSNGRSDRADLQDYRFESTYLGLTEQGDASYRVTMRRI